MSSSRRRVDHFQHHENHNTSQALHSSLLNDIKTNTANIKIDTGDIDLNTDGLETLIQATNDKLDSFSGHSNNTTAIGDGSTQLRVLPLGYNQSAGQVRSLLCDSVGHQQIDIVSSALPSGGATEAKQDVQETTLNSIQTAVEIIDNAIDGTEMRCDIIASLPAGTNAIGKLSANSGVDIGDVDVTSLPLTFNSGNKDGTCQRVVVATDDINISAIKASLDNIDNAVDGNYLNVNANIAGTDVDSNSGNKSAATQRIVIADDDTNLSAIKTAVEILDNAIDGTEMRCDIIASLPAGTNAIGKLSANSGVDIGDVDVTSLPLTFNSGNKDGTCQRVVVATDDINISAIKASLDNIDNSVDGNYLNVNANIAGTDVDSNSGNKSAATQRIVIADDDVNISAIKASLDNIDNAVDGNYLNINQNIAGTDVDSNSGNKSAATQRIVIATDDINLSAIKNAVEILDNAIDGTEMRCDIIASLPAGTNAIGKLSANSGVDIGDVDVTTLPLTFNSGNKDATCQRVVVATDDINISAIKASLDSIDNAVDGNYLNVNQNIAGTDVDSNSGNKSAATQRIVIADDDTNLSAIKTAVELLDDCVGTDNSTGPAKCLSIGGTNPLSGNIQEIAVDSSGHLSVDILSSALPSGAANQITTNNILTKATLQTSAEVKELLSGVTVNSGALSSEFDTENYERVRFFGETTTSVGTDIVLMGSNESGGTFYILGENLRSETIGSTHYVYGSGTENLPRYIKLLNKSGSSNYIFTKLYLQASGGRLLV